MHKYTHNQLLYCDMTPEKPEYWSHNRQALLHNSSVNERQKTRNNSLTTNRNVLCGGRKTGNNSLTADRYVPCRVGPLVIYTEERRTFIFRQSIFFLDSDLLEQIRLSQLQRWLRK
jgi:hypothetical protein